MNRELYKWYEDNKRELPWRETKNPYYIWLSEVILQQTRVAQGLDYYLRFVLHFPSVASLAAASEQDVLHLWQGLGYYSRARNLHVAAKTIVERWEGAFPHTYDEIRTLKGVGEYTAAAIASFAFDLPHAVVDGNVQRVLSRLFAIDTPIDTTKGRKMIQAIADEWMDSSRPALHNQAIMEFGALQCIPSKPDCTACPLQTYCLGYERKLIDKLPIKEGKTKVRTRYFSYFFIHCGGFTILEQRTAKDIWHNMYQFPLIETTEEVAIQQLSQETAFQTLLPNNTPPPHIRMANNTYKHILSHQIIKATLYEIELTELPNLPLPYITIPTSEMDNYPLYRLMTKMIEGLGSKL